ncbi:ABC transporter substrate-binding protein [Oligoflexus tunisiensis]|uniref:ABC transporter substrate-binding protein n=1 Tax=Oligoflexus tunisiensis TaxID=708132 RepID=UPI00159EF5B3|nr:extracellular solute-binding protein [Oligoflexus tunisiensis]
MKSWLVASILLCSSVSAWAKDTLVILSPHRKSIQEEFVPPFTEYYKKTYKTEVDVQWLDQGGTSDDVRFLRAKFANGKKSSGVDIFWGGGTATFMELQRDGFLATFKLPASLKAEVPEKAAGIPLYDKTQTWYASAMSSFGVFFNKIIMKMDGLPEPKTWQDLGNPVYRGNISLTDPRRSGSANTMNAIILQTMGWDKGWELLTTIAGNARSFTHSSSDPIKAVVSGDAGLAMAIDFYALAKIGDLGPKNLGFLLPQGQSVLDPDPIAILKGAPNRKVAERFVEYVLSAEAQKLLLLPKDAPGGPRHSSLGRMAVNTRAYAETEGKRISPVNPFTQKDFIMLDLERATKMQRVFNDLVGATLVDTHDDLRKAWTKIVRGKKKIDPAQVAAFGKPALSEAEFMQLVDKWDDEVVRNKTINAWVSASREKYKSLQ